MAIGRMIKEALEKKGFQEVAKSGEITGHEQLQTE
jgi:hypothetical protein